MKELVVKPKKSVYDPDPQKIFLFNVNSVEKIIYIPLYQYPKYFDDYPTTRLDYPRQYLRFKYDLLTKETDPSKRGRDQNVLVSQAIDTLKEKHSVFISAYTGYGKCLAPGTKVLMFDGTKKNVEDILIGEKIMGDDSNPRTILSICEGQEEMYEIVPHKGESFRANKSHILTLRSSDQGRIHYSKKEKSYVCSWFDGTKCTSKSFKDINDANEFSRKVKLVDTFDISIEDYLKLNNQAKHVLKLFWTSVEYKSKTVPIEPRYLGLWLGDGTSVKTSITNVDNEIIEYIQDFSKREGLFCYVYHDKNNIPSVITKGNDKTKHSNHLLDKMRDMNLIGNKHIPLIYKANSRKVRLELLAGLIDSDGYYTRGCYEITQKNSTLAYDIQDLCRSLGFACFVYPVKKYCIYKGEKRKGLYYRISFSGEGIEKIPVLLDRKRGEERTQKKNSLVTSFNIFSKGKGKYYGFTIDGNGRFLLGSHMVTHNTSICIYLMCYFGYKTIVLCHNNTIKNQWIDEITKFTKGKAKIQVISGKKKIDLDANVYIVGVLKAKSLIREDVRHIGMVIVDESHICTITAFTKSLLRFQPRYLIGLSATPERADGMQKLFDVYFGPRKEFIYRFEVKKFTVTKYTTSYKPVVDYQVVHGNTILNWSFMMTSLANMKERTIEIANIAIRRHDRKIILMCDRNNMATETFDYLTKKGESVELYIGKSKTWDRTKRILVTNVKKGSVGLNDPTLDMIIIAADMKNVKQCEGRIRTTNNDVYDIVDDYSTLERHWNDRRKWYINRGAEIIEEGPRAYKTKSNTSNRNSSNRSVKRYLGK